MKVVVTGADGFLGWHTRVRLRALMDHDVVPVPRGSWDRLPALVAGADAVIHLAGVNRGTDEEVERGNVRLAEELVRAVGSAGRSVHSAPNIVYANTIHSDADTPYGRGKAAAAAVLARGCAEWGSHFTDILFPNLFGEDGRPQYNSFVATFVDAVVRDAAPESVVDRGIELLHAQDAAAAVIAALGDPVSRLPRGTPTTVKRVLDTLMAQHAAYRKAQFPDLRDRLDVDLFNTLRARLFAKDRLPTPLTVHADARGRLIETARSAGGPSQVFVSTTRPGITRGEHYHLRKIERFAVVGGHARISLRKVCGSQVVSFDVSGDTPAVVDMPTMWVHNITNTGSTELVTMFWTNELFDPDSPDTYWEPVASADTLSGGRVA